LFACAFFGTLGRIPQAESRKTHVVDIDPRFCTKHLDIRLVSVSGDTTNVCHAVDPISKLDDTNPVVGILVFGKLRMLDWLAKRVDFVHLLLTVGASRGNSGEPSCRINLVYSNVGEQSPGGGRKSDEEAWKTQMTAVSTKPTNSPDSS